MTANEEIPEHLKYTDVNEETFAEKPILLRRTSGAVRITIFEGGHNILAGAACAWLANQQKALIPDWQLCSSIKINQAEELAH